MGIVVEYLYTQLCWVRGFLGCRGRMYILIFIDKYMHVYTCVCVYMHGV